MNLESILPEIKEGAASIFASEENAKRMVNDSNLEDILKEWITNDGEEILAHRTSAVSHAILIVTLYHEKYYLYRFFPTYEKWNVSVDVNDKPLTDLLNFLLAYR